MWTGRSGGATLALHQRALPARFSLAQNDLTGTGPLRNVTGQRQLVPGVLRCGPLPSRAVCPHSSTAPLPSQVIPR